MKSKCLPSQWMKPSWWCLIMLICLMSACSRDTNSKGISDAESLEKLARSGDPSAQNQWGFNLFNGYGVAKNPEEGLDWIQKSANQNFAKAQYNLALFHQDGKGVEPDLVKAFELMLKAGRQGLPEAETALGYMYERGQGVKSDITEALYWYRQASTFGGECKRSADHFKENLLVHRQEQYLYGDRNAQYMLGRIYETGAGGVFPNIDEAIRWYEDAAVRGDTASQAKLAVLYGIMGKPRMDKQLGYAWAKVADGSATNEKMKKPYETLKTVISPAEESMGDTTFQQLSALIAYNLKDLNLAP